MALGLARRRGVSRIVQVGDFGFFWNGFDRTMALQETLEHLDMNLDFLDGNHEDFARLKPYMGGAEPVEIRPRIRYLPRGCTWTEGDYRFMALGGAVSMDQHQRLAGATWFPEETLTQSDIDRACAAGKVDVLLSHDAPTTPSLNEFLSRRSSWWSSALARTSEANRMAVEMVVEAVQPDLIIHGHYHHRYSDVYVARDGHRSKVIGLDRDRTGNKSWVLFGDALYA
jgi:hypothetical protein